MKPDTISFNAEGIECIFANQWDQALVVMSSEASFRDLQRPGPDHGDTLGYRNEPAHGHQTVRPIAEVHYLQVELCGGEDEAECFDYPE